MSTKPKAEESDFYIHPYDHEAHLAAHLAFLRTADREDWRTQETGLIEIVKEKHVGIIRRWVRKIAIEVLENFVKNDLDRHLTGVGFSRQKDLLTLYEKTDFLLNHAGYHMVHKHEGWRFEKLPGVITPRPAKKKGKK